MLYDLWYEQREEVIQTYTEELPERIPLVDNPEFKSIKNLVIQEALNISADRVIVDEQDEKAEDDAELSEPEADEVEEQAYAPAPRAVQRSRVWQLYQSAKDLLDRESDAYDPNTAVDLLIEAAGLGYGAAEYQLGKIYLYGKEVERDDEKAIAYLSSAVEHGNPYAEQLLHSIQSNRSWPAALGAIRLLHHLSRVIQNQLDEGKRDNSGAIDRKLKRKIDEKKQAHGLKQG